MLLLNAPLRHIAKLRNVARGLCHSLFARPPCEDLYSWIAIFWSHDGLLFLDCYRKDDWIYFTRTPLQKLTESTSLWKDTQRWNAHTSSSRRIILDALIPLGPCKYGGSHVWTKSQLTFNWTSGEESKTTNNHVSVTVRDCNARYMDIWNGNYNVLL